MEIALTVECIRRGSPYGYLQGLQILNVALGGFIPGHLPSDRWEGALLHNQTLKGYSNHSIDIEGDTSV